MATLAFMLCCTACGGNDDEKTKDTDNDEASASIEGTLKAAEEMAKQVEENQKNGPVETVDFRKLKELLPAEADGLPRKNAEGEKNGMAGFTFSTATGRYENSDDTENIDLSIVDTGGSGAMMGMAAWSMVDMDRETEAGYEKTTTIDGNKAYEKFDNAGKSGEIAMLVNNRFVISAKGRGVDMAKLKSVLNDVDLDKLKSY
ncbi:transposase [Fibrella aquatica]|uniref:transposase n=1 Tax=Fibrella aquatica TaxID=3242487 RepID=UPI0035217760